MHKARERERERERKKERKKKKKNQVGISSSTIGIVAYKTISSQFAFLLQM
jgi:hypothetical protein